METSSTEANMNSTNDGEIPHISADAIAQRNNELFEELKIRRRHRYLIFKLDDASTNVETIGDRAESFQDFCKKLPFSECRYCVYDQDIITADKRQISKLWFISWFPFNSTPHSKMSYTTAKKDFTQKFSGVYDIQCSSVKDLEQCLGLGKDEEEDGEFEF